MSSGVWILVWILAGSLYKEPQDTSEPIESIKFSNSESSGEFRLTISEPSENIVLRTLTSLTRAGKTCLLDF